MRLRRLDLTRYGKFTERSIDFGERVEGQADLHVVYGLNEAGKSTALSGFLDLLFGIEERTRYAFLHGYGAMEIGARLEFDGRAHDFVRRKQRTGSLVDAEGRPLSEALLAGALSGLGREAYRTMFSLDDETLEAGGDAILRSQGDLGELLFSASAGLADVGASLAKAADEADSIHKKRARSTEIAGLKQRLAEMKARREAIDTAAAAFRALGEAAARASGAYEAAMAERGSVKAELDRTQRALRAHPLADELRRLTLDLERHGDLPRPPAAWARELPPLMEAETRLDALVGASQERRTALTGEIDGLVPDLPVLDLSVEIRGLAEAMGRYGAAQEDLPRRRVSMKELDAALNSILEALGQGGHDSPSALLLPASTTGTLRDLIEARSGIDARLRTAERELADAAGSLDRRTEERERSRAGAVGGEDALREVDEVLRRLRRSDAPTRARLAERERPKAERRAAEAMEALAPWTGDAAALRAMDPPEARRLEAWRSQLAQVERRRAGHRERHREIATRAGDLSVRLDALRQAAGSIEDAEAHRLRAARNEAWTRHRAALDEPSAAAFEAALEADDRIAENRLAKTRDVAELRQLASALAVEEAALRREEALLAEADADAAALSAEIRAEAGIDLAAGKGTAPAGWLDRIEGWSRRRIAALEAVAALAVIETEAARSREELEEDRRALADALATSGHEIEHAALPDLIDAAERLIANQAAERAERAAVARRIAEAEEDLASRRRDRDEAAEAAKDWDRRWEKALAGTWIDVAQPVGAVREILRRLGDLPGALRERDEMHHRIETMERDQAGAVARLAEVSARLGEDRGSVSPMRAVADLAARLDRAERAAEARAAKLDEQRRLEGRLRELEEELRVQAARKAEMTGFFGVATLAEVGAALEGAADRKRTEERIGEVGAQLAAEMQEASTQDALAALGRIDLAQAERQAGELAARHEDLDQRTRDLFAEKTRAADQLAGVGGDDAVARLQVERQTVLIEIEEAALRHLRLRAGTLVAQEALRAYRDRHRSTMMGRASQAFAAMTRGDYSGLSARPEKDRETLIGLTRDGGSKLAADMSKGTRFQLYLALRLAGYEEFARARRAVPFVADDIMETFDEPRSEEVLRLLAGMSQIGQVIYFTHHRHLCDIAESVEPAVRIHRL